MRTRSIVVLGLALVMFAGGAVMLGVSGGRMEPAAAGLGSPDVLAKVEVATLADIDGTIAMLQDRLRAADADSLDLAALGAAYLQKARATADPSYYRLAGSALRKSLRQEPGNLTSVLGMGQLALAQHDFAAAARWGRKALAIDAYNATAHGIIGDARVELGDYVGAFRSWQKMIDLKPSLSSYARVSYARELTGDVNGAIAAMRRAQEAAGGVAENVAWTRNQLGDLYFNSGRFRLAEREYRMALAAAPDFVPPDAGLGRVEAAGGHFAAAASRYRAIVGRFPLPQYVMTLGDLYSVMGRGRAARRQYDLVDAQRRLFEANGVLPDVEISLFFADHDPMLALRLARAQYSERPSVRVADALAWALYANGRYESASRFSAEFLELGTPDASYHYHAGMIARAMDHDGAARRHLVRAREINPAFSVLHSPRLEHVLEGLGAAR